MNTELLLELADHLEFGKLGHKKFDFSTYNDTTSRKCGTAGCALGECPILFPYDWTWGMSGNPFLVFGSKVSPHHDAQRFFDINCAECDFLFHPDMTIQYKICPLPANATRLQVALHIRKFVREGGIYWRAAK